MRILQSFTNEALAKNRFAAAVDRAYAAAVDSTRARAVLTAIAIFLVFGSVVVVLWVGAQDVLDDVHHARTARPSSCSTPCSPRAGWGSFRKSGARFRSPPARPSGCSRSWRSGRRSCRRRGRRRSLSRRAARSPSQDVHFAYPTRPEISALNGVTFAVRRGEKVAIVGPSGAGKSTIFQLILRFYDPTSGAVSFDGVALAGRRSRGVARRIRRSSRRIR